MNNALYTGEQIESFLSGMNSCLNDVYSSINKKQDIAIDDIILDTIPQDKHNKPDSYYDTDDRILDY